MAVFDISGVHITLSLLLTLLWGFITLLLMILLFLDQYFSQENLPYICRAAIRYGKLIDKSFIQVPKRWFMHFYLVGAIVNSTVSILLLSAVADENFPKLPGYLGLVQQWSLGGPHAIDYSTATFLLMLMSVQNIRRLYESVVITNFSDSHMSVLHYGIGHLLYCTYHLVVLSEVTTEFTDQKPFARFHRVAGLAMFSVASFYQHKAALHFAKLRQKNTGQSKSKNHFIPTEGLFKLVSCPHYFCEIIIYLGFWIIGGCVHSALSFVVAFVVFNQLMTGYLAHQWYLRQFPQYKALNRKAVIPFLF